MNPTTPRESRRWPGYIFGGRMRTTTAALLVAFFAIWWLYETYEPAPAPQQVPAREVVPPGFIPDPDYTWAPRSDVQRHTPTTTIPTTTPTTSTTPSVSETTTTPGPSSTPVEPVAPTSAPGPASSPVSPTPPRTSESPGPGVADRPQPPTQTPAAAAVVPTTPAVSPPR